MVIDAAYLGLLLLLQLGTPVYDRVILGGHVMDPASGLDAVRNLGLSGGRIAVITTEAVLGRDTVDARGLVVAPGFIDLHAHGQTPETYRFYSLDGVTTALELELGTSDVAAWYGERSAGEPINYGVSIGHIKVRMAVMHDSGTWMPVSDGAYRAASPEQIGEIAQRIEIGLSEGAVSIGAGFPYTPAATRDELLAVFRVAAQPKAPIHLPLRPGDHQSTHHHGERRILAERHGPSADHGDLRKGARPLRTRGAGICRGAACCAPSYRHPLANGRDPENDAHAGAATRGPSPGDAA